MTKSTTSTRPGVGRRFSAFLGFIAATIVAGVLVAALFVPGAAMGATAVTTGAKAFDALPDYLKIEPPGQVSTFYAKQGGENVKIAQFYFQNRVDVEWDQVSQYVKDAAVATEDPRFYTEGGVDLTGLARGAASTISGNGLQGGSSITQQYVKNVLVQRCEAHNPVDASTADARAKQQKALSECYRDAAGVSLPRKIQEIRYATGLAKRYSKTDILLGYLNLVGFGGKVYGVEAAARYYFNTTAAKLDLNQSATLVAILNEPSKLRIDQSATANPASNSANGFAATKNRRDYVLDRMVEEKKITAELAAQTQKQPIAPKITPTPTGCTTAEQFKAGFFCDYVQNVILNDEAFGKTATERRRLLSQGGINVFTTLNLDLQRTPQESLDAYLPHAHAGFDLGGAHTAMEVGTGRVVTMVQNKTYDNSAASPPGSTSVNYSVPYEYGHSGGFQLGSSFKPFVLAGWLQNGHALSDVINGRSTTFNFQDFKTTCGSNAPYGHGSFTVYNDASWENGSHTVLKATTASINTVYMNMAKQLNLCDIGELANSMGLRTSNPAEKWTTVPVSAIGSGNNVSPLQVAQSYAAFANGGVSCTPIAIDSVTRADGGEALAVPKTNCTRAISEGVANAVLYALKGVMSSGTGVLGNPFDGVPLAGKTGTAGVKGNAGATQNWIATTTTKVAQATWVGNVSGTVGLRTQSFTNAHTGRVINGGDAKLIIAKPIIAALNATYGGTNFGTPPYRLVQGNNPLPTPAPAPTPSESTETDDSQPQQSATPPTAPTAAPRNPSNRSWNAPTPRPNG